MIRHYFAFDADASIADKADADYADDAIISLSFAAAITLIATIYLTCCCIRHIASRHYITMTFIADARWLRQRR